MAGRRKVNTEERLDDASIERVIKYLEEKGSTKKNACQILNISYNTTRLDKLINDFIKKKEEDARRRAEKRGKPANNQEISYIISEYLAGSPLSSIASSIYRGTAFVKSVLDSYAVPERNSSPDYFHPKLIPEEASRPRFGVGEKVYSARYDVLADVEKEYEKDGQYYYRLYLRGEWMQYCYQPAHEIASLEKLKEVGVML